MPWHYTDMPDLTGLVAVVTGANGGLGLESTKALAGSGAHVVMAARNQVKAKEAFEDVVAGNPDASLEIIELDLGSQSSVVAAAARILGAHPKVDILMNNAGLMAMPERRTEDGWEMQLGVNHFGHWTFTAKLLPGLLAAEAARVVTVTSTAHLFGRPADPGNINMDGIYDPWGAYGRAKLANYLFGLGLQDRFERHDLAAQSLVAHPGLAHTNLQVHTNAEGGAGSSGPFWEWMAAKTGMDADDGARSQVRAATDPAAEGGEFYGPRWGNFGAPVSKPILRRGNAADIDALWEYSERETGISFDFGAGG